MTVTRFTNGMRCATNENVSVRKHARMNGVPLWMIAERYGVRDSRLSIMLRRELPKETQEDLIAIIDEIADERKSDNAG